MNLYIYRYRLKGTDLFYDNKKGRWSDTITNFTKTGKFYMEKNLKQALNTQCKVNKAQIKKYNIDYYNKCSYDDSKFISNDHLELVKYELIEVKL